MQLAIIGATASMRWRRAIPVLVRWTMSCLAACLVALASSSAAASSCALPAEPTVLDALASVEGPLPALPELAASDPARVLLQRSSRRVEGEDVVAVDAEIAASDVYGVPWPTAAGNESDRSPTAQAVAAWAEAASRSVSAYGVFVHDRSLGAIVAAGTYWTSPLLDRLEVTRLTAPWPGAMPNARLLAASGSCRVDVRTWLELPVELVEQMTALDDDEADASTSVYLVANVPGRDPARSWIDLDELLDAVTFDHPATRDATSFYAWFVGPSANPVTLARALPRVRSNLGPRALWGLVQDLR